MNKITFDSIEEIFGSILPIIIMILLISFFSFWIGYFIGEKEGYYKGKTIVYEKVLNERSNE